MSPADVPAAPTTAESESGRPTSMPLGELLGITTLLVEPDHVVCRLQITDDHLNQGLLAHGGALFTLADTAIGLAANPSGTDTPWVGTSFAVSLYRGVGVGDVVRATATLENRSRRLAAYRAELRAEAGGRLLGTVVAQLLTAPLTSEPPASPTWRSADPQAPLVRALRAHRSSEQADGMPTTATTTNQPAAPARTQILRSGDQPLGLDDRDGTGSWIHPRWRSVLPDEQSAVQPTDS